MAITCYKCKKQLDLVAGSNVPKSEECPSCLSDLHCCKMCQFYDPSVYNECRETSADRIVEKEKANFCDHFKLAGLSGGVDPAKAALDAANALFKK